ncbi:MAG: DUF763 domain-containing protein [Candidatus Baldrarchaeia archaeon]
MKRTGTAILPLHGGKAPPWLIKRMITLGRAIFDVIIEEYGPLEVLKRLSDPYWFQCLSCVLGYDWHSSGTTTVTMGVLREVFDPEVHSIAVVGGKGKRSRKTPDEIPEVGRIFDFSDDDIGNLIRTSRLVAKVDNVAIQDGFQLYHHSMVICRDGNWAVIQQGMDPDSREARRYHWLSLNVRSFVEEPHTGIITERFKDRVLDMTAKESEECRNISVDLIREGPKKIRNLLRSIKSPFQRSLFGEQVPENVTERILVMPRKIDWKAVEIAYQLQPSNFEELLLVKGIGPGVVRALALISELIWGAPPSWKDPAKFAFAHGGKDRVPYPVNIRWMEHSTRILREALEQAKVGNKEKLMALKRLKEFLNR